MRCSKCGTEGISGKRFCAECGSPLSNRCSKCNSDNAPDAKFCADCGNPLDKPVSPSISTTPFVVLPEVAGERRHLTILFCDLVGSVTLAAQVDPEEWRATVASYQRAASEAITRFGGEVMRYVGDGIMAFFGYPIAHDNDAERAVRAGLAILDAIARLNEQPAHTKLAVRIGIDSGRVVVGAGTGNAVDAFGDAANIAARVQAAAEPGSVMISEATQRLVAGLFIVEDRGAHPLKGVPQPVRLYRVIRPSGARGRFEAASAAGGLTSFVGREDELRSLMSRWERVLEGEGQVVTIIGEAGIGKSRLVQRFHAEIAGTPHTWLDCGTAPFFQNTPFFAVSGMLQQSFQWEATQNAEQRLNALEASLALAGLNPAETAPLIAPLLELPAGERYPPLSISPDQQRKRLLTTLAGWTFGAAKAQPMVIATEDLHWADPSTLELTQLLVEQGAPVRLLLLYTARPEFRAQWPQRAHHTQIMLNRLSARDIRAIIARVAVAKALSDETITTVIERTGGVPLFVEELTRALLESGDAKLSGREIPATLHDSLMARLDRLGEAKEIIQIGSIIGSDFSYELLHAVHPIPEANLQRALCTLTDAELLYVRGIAPEATYQFKHALIRDAAYEALLKSRRKELHRSVAETIDQKFAPIKEAHPEVLARHWTEAGEPEAAITQWQKAGERAIARRAFREGEQHYRDAIAALETLPESSDRDGRELSLQVAQGRVMSVTQGFSAVETAEAYQRARVLAERTAGVDSLQLLEVLNGLRNIAATRGELRAALTLADQILELARGIGSRHVLTDAHHAAGGPRYYLGDLVGARHHFFEAIEQYREADFAGTSGLYDPGIASYVWLALTECFLGMPDAALRCLDSAEALARRQNNPFNLAMVYAVGSSVHSYRGDFQRVLKTADEAVMLSAGLGFPVWGIVCKIRSAWARAQMGEVGGAVDSIQRGIEEFDNIKFSLTRAMYLCNLCETQAASGAIDEALVSVERALQVNPEELLYRPLALTLRGEMRLRSEVMAGTPQSGLAEQDFREAIRLACTMKARSFEMRATTSLARLLDKQGRRDEARVMLAEIYGWFTEGFDTADLKDARALLDELSG
jgi:class 3 adenylate cyclase/tetratricopeptide (TPR) repeat protein